MQSNLQRFHFALVKEFRLTLHSNLLASTPSQPAPLVWGLTDCSTFDLFLSLFVHLEEHDQNLTLLNFLSALATNSFSECSISLFLPFSFGEDVSLLPTSKICVQGTRHIFRLLASLAVLQVMENWVGAWEHRQVMEIPILIWRRCPCFPLSRYVSRVRGTSSDCLLHSQYFR